MNRETEAESVLLASFREQMTDFRDTLGKIDTKIDSNNDKIEQKISAILAKLDDHTLDEVKYKSEINTRFLTQENTIENMKKRIKNIEDQNSAKTSRKTNFFDKISSALLITIISGTLMYFVGVYHEYLKYQEPPTSTHTSVLKK